MAQAIPITEIELYEAIKSKLGEKKAKSLVQYVGETIEKKIEEKKNAFATKEDIKELSEDIKALKERINQLEIKLEIKIEAIRSDIIRWMFLFWIGQFAALIAILQLFFK